MGMGTEKWLKGSCLWTPRKTINIVQRSRWVYGHGKMAGRLLSVDTKTSNIVPRLRWVYGHGKMAGRLLLSVDTRIDN